MSLFDLHVSVFIVAFNAVIMKLGQCVYEFSLGLLLYEVFFCLKLLVRSDVCFCNIAQVLLGMCIFLCGPEVLTIHVSDCSIFLLSMEILSTADWQGCLLAFDKLDQAFENGKCRNSDNDFQCDVIFPLVSSKFNQTRRRKHTKKATRC